ncbi:MAG: hypothetical protein AAFS06_10380 [Cyanobacteria bacterium J06631_12]
MAVRQVWAAKQPSWATYTQKSNCQQTQSLQLAASSQPSPMTSSPQTQQQQRERLAYEKLLADCCHYDGILSVLNQHRPYFESLPSIRRLQESMVIIPLPNVRSREVSEVGGQIDTAYHIRSLPCDLALMICDPEWKIKTGIEIVLFIQRPGEDLSDLLRRWRQTQIELGQGVEWLMPRKHRHLLAEGTEEPHPLFVVFTTHPEDEHREKSAPESATVTTAKHTINSTPANTTQNAAKSAVEKVICLEHSNRSERILQGLKGAKLPTAIQSLEPQ